MTRGNVSEMAAAVKAEVAKEREQFAGFLTAKELLDRPVQKTADVIGRGIGPEGTGIIIPGPGGLGKSMLRTDLALHLALGMDIWGLPVPKARRVLVCQFENTWQTEQTRLRRMVHGLGDGQARVPANLSFSNPSFRFDLAKICDRAKLEAMVKESGADVVIYDPLASLSSADENKNDQMRAVLDSLTQINRRCETTCFLIHHFRKPSENGDAGSAWMMRGAVAIRDWCDTQITATRRPNEHKILIQLEFHKMRNGPEHKSILLERDPDTFLHHVVDEDCLCPASKVLDILESLGGRAENQKELIGAVMDAVGCKSRSAVTFIKNAVESGHIRETKEGKCRGYEAA